MVVMSFGRSTTAGGCVVSRWAKRWIPVTFAVSVLLAMSGASAAATVTPTLAPVGGDYAADALQGFARIAAEHATSPTVDILVVPSAYGTTPSIGQNTQLALKRTDQIAAACNAIVGEYAGLSGCTARLVPLFTRASAEDPANAALFDAPSLDGVFILGGDQDLAMEALAGTATESAMAGAYHRGVVVSGTSAGDAVESRNMIWGFTDSGSQDNELQRGSVLVWWGDDNDLERGLSFGSTATILDQHFYQMGRFGRLLNVVAQSDDRFGGASRLGVGVDLVTGVRLTGDARLSDVWGASSAAVIDGETAGATHTWKGADRTLSERNVLTHLIPSGDFSYDVAARTPFSHGHPVAFRSPGAWSAGLLHAPGRAALLLGGDVSATPSGAVLSQFVQRAKASGKSRIVEVFAGYSSTGTTNDQQTYRKAVAAAGWSGTVTQVIYGQHALSNTDLAGAAGVLFVGGDQAKLAAPVGDAGFRSFVRAAMNGAPVVMTDHAMTAAMGSWYSALPEPGPKTLETQGVDSFRSDGVPVRAGLGILPGVSLEPRLTADYRWGRLYGLAHAHPNAIVLGICQDTGIVLDGGSATLAGDLSAVSLDARAATFATGGNGALAAFNVLVNTYAPGDSIG
jgi:cyanophycinase